MDRSSSWTNADHNGDFTPPSRVARMVAQSPRPPPGSTAEAVATARRAEYGTGGSILPVLPSASPNAFKRSSWTTSLEDEPHQPTNESFAPPSRRAEVASMAATRRTEPARPHPVDGLFASETEQAQLAYMEQMYGTINLLNAELESERRSRAALEATRPTTYSATSDYLSIGEVPVNDPPAGYLVSQTPVAPSYSPRKLRTMPTPPSQTQHRVARPPVSPRSIAKDQELCTTLGKNAELRIRSRDMERSVDKTELELELAHKQIKMAERRAENREEKLRALLKDKLNAQKELKATRAQVVEEKMRQVDLFREVEAAKRHFAEELEAVEQELRAAQEDNTHLRTHAAEIKAQMNFQTRKMDDMARQAQDEKARFVVMIEDTRHRFREWKEGEAEALETAHDQAIRNLKTEYELKMERHQDEKQKLRDKVNDLEVSMRLLQKDRALSPLELSLRKAVILGSKENTGTFEAEQIEAQSRILELENLLAHSQEYQARQESVIKLSEATISRLMREREVTALENLSLHPFGVGSEDLSYDTQLTGYVTAPSSPARRTSPLNNPSRTHQNPVKSIEPLNVRSPKSRSHTPKLEANTCSTNAAQIQEQSSASNRSAGTDNLVPSTREQNLLDELVQLRKELVEAKANTVEVPSGVSINDCIVKVPCETLIPSDEAPVQNVDEERHADSNLNDADEIDAASSPDVHTKPPNETGSSKSDSCESLIGETTDPTKDKSVAVPVEEAVVSGKSNSQAEDDPAVDDHSAHDINVRTAAREGEAKTISSLDTAEQVDDSSIVGATEQNDSVKGGVDESLEVQNTPMEALAAGAKLGENVVQTTDLTPTDVDSVVAVVEDHDEESLFEVPSTPEGAAPNEAKGNETSEPADVQQSDVSAKDGSAVELRHNNVDGDDTGELVLISEPEIAKNDNKTRIDDLGEVQGGLKLPNSDIIASDEESKDENAGQDDESVCSLERKGMAANPTPEPLEEISPAYEENETLPTPDIDVSTESDGDGHDEFTHVNSTGVTGVQQTSVEEVDVPELACLSENETKEVDNKLEDLLVDEVPAKLQLQKSVAEEESKNVRAKTIDLPIPNSEITELPELEIEAQSSHVEDVELHSSIIIDLEENSQYAININDGLFEESIQSADNPANDSNDAVDASDPETTSEILEEPAFFPPVRSDFTLQRAISASESGEIDPVFLPSESPETMVAEAFVTLVECTALSLVSSRQKRIDDTSGRSLENIEDATNVTSAAPENVVTDPAEATGPRDELDTVDDSSKTVTIDIDEPVHDEQTIATPDTAVEEAFGVNTAAEEQNITLIEAPDMENEKFVAAIAKTFAEKFVKEVIDMFDSAPSSSETQETHDGAVKEVVAATFADATSVAAEDKTTKVCAAISTNDTTATETTAQTVEDVCPTDTPNPTAPCDELLNDSPDSTTLSKDDQLISDTPANITPESAAVKAEDIFPVDHGVSDSSESGIAADSVHDLVIESPADTFAVAKDVVGAVESEALSAILKWLNDASRLDTTQADSDHEHERHESNSTCSIIESCNHLSEEQDGFYSAIIVPDAVGLPTNVVAEDCNGVEDTSSFTPDNAVDEVRRTDLDAEHSYSIDELADTAPVEEIVRVVNDCMATVESEGLANLSAPNSTSDCLGASENPETRDTEERTEPDLRTFSTQQIVSDLACHFAPQVIAEVLTKLSEPCTLAEIENIVGEDYNPLPQETPFVECGSETSEAPPEVPGSVEEVNSPDIPPMEPTGDESAAVSDNSVVVPAVDNAADLQIEDNDKTVKLLLAEMIAMITLEEDGASCDEVDQGMHSVANQANGDIAVASLDETDEKPSDTLDLQRETRDNSPLVLIDNSPSIQECKAVSAEKIIPPTNAQTLQDYTSAATEDEIPNKKDQVPTSESNKGRLNDTISHKVDQDAGTTYIDGVDPINSVVESIIDIACYKVELGVESRDIDESQTVDKKDDGVAVEPTHEFIVPTTEESTAVELSGVIRKPTAEGNEVSTLEVEVRESLDTNDEDPDKHSDIELYAASSFGLTLDDEEAVFRFTLESLVDRIIHNSEVSCTGTQAHTPIVSLGKNIVEDHFEDDMIAEMPAVVVEDTDELPQGECNKTSEAESSNAVKEVVTDMCTSVEKKVAPKHRARSVHFSCGTNEEQPGCHNQARRSVLLWKAPFNTACMKEAVENSAKRRASRRRTSRRALADLLAFPTELARFTTSDTTLLAYDARHEQGQQPFSLLDYSILNINPHGRHIHLDDQDERVESNIICKRKTLMQELHSKNLALRQIPRFNYMPMRIKFQWSDFVVATPVRPSSTHFGEGHISKSPIDPLRLLQKKGAKLPCGSYVIVSAFIRPLEDGNENLSVQIYDSERVEEFQFDFSEDIIKKYHLETTGMEAQSLEFLGHLEFRRDEDTIIIKLPEKKAEDGSKAEGERIQSERTMFAGGGDPRKREPKQKMSAFRQNRPASSQAITGSLDLLEFSSSSREPSSFELPSGACAENASQ